MFFKKAIVVLVIFQLIVTTSFCQDWCDTVISNIKGKQIYSDITPELDAIRHKFLLFNKKNEFGVDIFFGVYEKNNLDKSSDEVYLIDIYSKNDTIFLIDIATTKLRKFHTEEIPFEPQKVVGKFRKIDTTVINVVLSEHNAKYSSSKKIEDYFKGLNSKGEDEILNTTFFLSAFNKKYFAELIKARNHNKLVELAASLNAELRAYGTVGLYLLELDGEKISNFEKSLILLNQASNVIISELSSGFAVYFFNPFYDNIVDTDIEMSAQLDDKFMKVYYSLLKEQKLL